MSLAPEEALLEMAKGIGNIAADASIATGDTFGPGDCCLQPPSILHNELECSDDLELIEITSPANYPTEAVGE